MNKNDYLKTIKNSLFKNIWLIIFLNKATFVKKRKRIVITGLSSTLDDPKTVIEYDVEQSNYDSFKEALNEYFGKRYEVKICKILKKAVGNYDSCI